jgi:hypothetical protein
MHTFKTQLQMNKLKIQMKTPSCSNLPAQFTYQPVAMSDSRGNFPNADALNKKTNILDILLKKMKSTKAAASDKSALQSMEQQEPIQQAL